MEEISLIRTSNSCKGHISFEYAIYSTHGDGIAPK